MRFYFFYGMISLIFLVLSACSHQTQIKNKILESNHKELSKLIKEIKAAPANAEYLATEIFLKANSSLMDEDFETASELFKHLNNLFPDDEFVQKKYAISLIKSGEIEPAIPVLEKIYQSKKESKMGLILAGLYSTVDSEAKANSIYKEILKKEPKNEDACIYLGKSYVSSKDNDRAIKVLEKCSVVNSKSGVYDFYIGKIYLDQGKTKEAIKFFNSSLTKQPTLNQVVGSLGAIYEEQENFNKAIATYKNFLKLKPNDTLVLSRLIQALFIKEQYEEIVPYAERLSDLEPEDLNLKVKLGVIYTDTGEFLKALSIFKELLQYAPESDKILYYIAAIYQEINNFQLAIEYFNQIPVTSPLFADSSIQIANMLSELALSNEDKFKNLFITYVNQSLENLPDLKVEFSVIKSGFYESIGDMKNALDTILVVQNEKGFSTNHKYYLANLYEKEKKFKESTDLILGILELEPKNAHALNFLGYAMLERGDEIDQAYLYIKKALEISPNDGYIRDSLGWYYFKKGELKKALREVEHAFKLVPDDSEILKHLGLIYKEMNNFKKARSFFNSALKYARYPLDRKAILISLDELDEARLPASNLLDP